MCTRESVCGHISLIFIKNTIQGRSNNSQHFPKINSRALQGTIMKEGLKLQ